MRLTEVYRDALKEAIPDADARAQHLFKSWHGLAQGDITNRANTNNINMRISAWSKWVNGKLDHVGPEEGDKEFIVDAYSEALVQLDTFLSKGMGENNAMQSVDFGGIIAKILPKYINMMPEAQVKKDIVAVLDQIENARWLASTSELTSGRPPQNKYTEYNIYIRHNGPPSRLPNWKSIGRWRLMFVKESGMAVLMEAGPLSVSLEFNHWEDAEAKQLGNEIRAILEERFEQA